MPSAAARTALAEVDDFSPEGIEPVLRGLVDEMGLKTGQVFGVVRSAATGKKVSPPLFGTLSAIGKEETLERIEKAIQILKNT